MNILERNFNPFKQTLTNLYKLSFQNHFTSYQK